MWCGKSGRWAYLQGVGVLLVQEVDHCLPWERSSGNHRIQQELDGSLSLKRRNTPNSFTLLYSVDILSELLGEANHITVLPFIIASVIFICK